MMTSSSETDPFATDHDSDDFDYEATPTNAISKRENIQKTTKKPVWKKATTKLQKQSQKPRKEK